MRSSTNRPVRHRRGAPACLRRGIPAAILAVTALTLGTAPPAGATTITVEMDFAAPTLVTRDGQTRIEVRDCTPLGAPGMPLLPAQGAVILLPPGEEIAAVRAYPAGSARIEGRHHIAHAQTPRPISLPGDWPVTPPNTDVYGSDEAYPSEAAKLVTVQRGWGHTLAFLQVYPVSYRPLSGELTAYDRVIVEVETRAVPGADPTRIELLRNDPATHERLATVVANPEDLTLYESAQALDARDSRIDPDYYPYVIITNDTFSNAFQELAVFESSRGMRARVVTLSEITPVYPGVDLAEQIRNFIYDAYLNWETRYVLLGGDRSIIPTRMLYCNAGGTIDRFPGECYYEGLDGTWNDDNDDRWGELDEADLINEVAVGRASIDTSEQLANWLHKNAMYTEAPVVEEILNALFLGEQLDETTYGGNYMDEVKDYAATHGYETCGYPGTYVKDMLYDRDITYTKWDVIDAFNAGYPSSHHLGHSNTQYAMKMVNSDVAYFTNDGVTHSYCFINTQGCYANNFDNLGADAISEALFYDDNGAAAFLGNTRYGWYMPSSTNGPSQHFDRQVVDAIYDEEIVEVGWANGDSKFDCIWMLDDYMLWCHYEICLLGDPAMPQWRDMLGDLALEHDGSYTLGQGVYYVTVRSGGEPVEGATVTLYSEDLVSWGTAMTNADGIAAVHPGDVLPGTLKLKAVKPDYLPATDEVPASPPSGPYLIVADATYLDPYGSETINAGESAMIDVLLQNVGPDPATGVSAVLSTTDEYVTVVTDTQGYPDIAPGGESWANDAFELAISPQCPDQHRVMLTLTMSCTGRPSWEAPLEFRVSAPIVTIAAIDIDDTVGGNGNYRLEPGEEAVISVSLNNAGTGGLPLVEGEFTCSHPMIDVLVGTGVITSGLNQGQTKLLSPPFEVAIDPAFPLYEGDFVLTLTGSLSFEQIEEITLPIGGFYETVESGPGDWTHAPAQAGWADQWHISSERNHTQNGMYSWKCGDEGTGAYTEDLDAALETQVIALGGQGQLIFWHWMEAEESGMYPGYAYDGGFVEMSVDGGDFEPIEPVGGYTHLVRNRFQSPGPYPSETPFFSGAFDWTEVTFDLDGVIGEVRFRFRFGSDYAVGYDGWYIDDVVIVGLASSSGAEELQPARLALSLTPSRPNPSPGLTRIAFTLPRAQEATLQVFDASGRLVRDLLRGEMPAGTHRAVWEGRDESGHQVSSGIYYYRLQTPDGRLQRPVVVLR